MTAAGGSAARVQAVERPSNRSCSHSHHARSCLNRGFRWLRPRDVRKSPVVLQSWTLYSRDHSRLGPVLQRSPKVSYLRWLLMRDLCTGRMSFLSLNQQCQCTGGIIHAICFVNLLEVSVLFLANEALGALWAEVMNYSSR